jgi:hypothetical protein
MNWKPAPSPGGLIGLGAILGVLLVDGLVILVLTRLPVSLASFVLALSVVVSLPLLALLAYRVFGFFNLSYRLDPDALTIVWAGTQQIIPLGAIRDVVTGEEVGVARPERRLRWVGYHVGYEELESIGPTLFYATRPLAEQVLVLTDGVAFGLSPADPQGFLADLEAHRKLALTPHHLSKGAEERRSEGERKRRQLEAPLLPCSLAPLLSRAGVTTRRWRVLELPLWEDRWAHALLGLAATLNAALFAYICLRYQALPALLPLHFDALGEPDRVGPRGELFWLPAIGLVVLSTNATLGALLHTRERLAAHLLFATAALVQLLLAVAIWNIVG